VSCQLDWQLTARTAAEALGHAFVIPVGDFHVCSLDDRQGASFLPGSVR
jgi:hypothetical protein